MSSADSSASPAVPDTVDNAAATPDQEQPYLQLGLKDDEYARIREILGRRPTESELAVYSVMWSEHCSYKSSKVHLRYFGETTTKQMGEKMLAGIGENAGVVDIGDGWAVTFKAESHNSPSYIDPYQGAATGVGGIVRDIIAMGARPIAVMDQLRMGPAEAEDTRRVLRGAVAGIADYGNTLGVPNIGGETVFDASYAGNPLVNALCVGAMRAEDLHLAFASGVGNRIVLFGKRTGRDGIGGVSVLASESFDEDPDEVPEIQKGDPALEKLVIEASLEAFAADLVVGIQDLGGAGLACATSELAAAGSGGMHIVLDRVPVSAENMTDAEVLCAETQERMCAVVAPENLDAFLAICDKWGVEATDIGEVTDGKTLVVEWHGQIVLDAPARTIADDGPVYERPMTRPAYLDALNADTTAALARPAGGEDLRETLLTMISAPQLASRKWIVDQFDRYARGNTVQAEGADAGVVRVDEETGRGIAVSADASGRYTQLDPYRGAQLALAEAYRNVSATGAEPAAVTNCLNFGSPEDPEVMWQFAQAVRGLADGCAELGIPVTGGNVSFYNQTGDTAILPTPLVGVLGVLDDVARSTPVGLGTEPGESLILLGETRDEFDGSMWAQIAHDHLGGTAPQVDLAREKLLSQVLIAGSRDGMVSAAHDLSEGGLAQAVVEAALAGQTGVRLVLPEGSDPFTMLFSESTGRALVAVPRTEEPRFTAMCEARGLPAVRIGVVDQGSTDLEVQGQFTVSLDELRDRHEKTLPALFD